MGRKVLLLIFGISIIYWIIFILISGYKEHPLGIYTQIPLIIIPITGGIIGLMRYKSWGGAKSIMGRALISLSLGMLVWGIALGIWTYFLSVSKTLPYPSLADYLFIWSPVFWIIGLIHLARVVGAPFTLRTFQEKLLGLVIIVIVTAVSYYILVVIAHGNVLSAPGETAAQIF